MRRGSVQYLSDIASKGPETSSKVSIRVPSLGDVELIRANVNGKLVWRGIHEKKLIRICAQKPNLAYTKFEMLQGKWAYESKLKNSRYRIDCIFLVEMKSKGSKTKNQEKKKDRSKKVSNGNNDMEAVDMTAARDVVETAKQNNQKTQKVDPEFKTKQYHHVEKFRTTQIVTKDIIHDTEIVIDQNESNSFASPTRFLSGWESILKASVDDISQTKVYLALITKHKRFLDSERDESASTKDIIEKLMIEVRAASQKQFQSEENEFLNDRLSRHLRNFENTPLFYEFCFDIFCSFSLDSGQLCDVLDFLEPSRDLFISFILREYEDTNWFVLNKIDWLRKQFGADIELPLKDLDFLAKMPWTVEPYHVFIRKLSKGYLSVQHLSDSGIGELEQSVVMNQIVLYGNSSCLSKAIKKNIQQQKLLHNLLSNGVTSSNIIFLLIGVLSDWKVNAIEPFNYYFTKLGNNSAWAKLFAALMCQSMFFGCPNKVTDSFFRALPSNHTREHILQNYQMFILDNVYKRDIVVRKNPNKSNIVLEKLKLSALKTVRLRILNRAFTIMYNIYSEDDSQRTNRKEYTMGIMDDIRKNDELYTTIQEISEHEQMSEVECVTKLFDIVQVVHTQNAIGFYLRPVQVISILCIMFHSVPGTKGLLCKIFTGEGKSCLVAMVAGIWGLQGEKVDVMTSSTELSLNEKNLFAEYFRYINLKVAALDSDDNMKEINQCDVLYGTVSSFIREKIENDGHNQFKRGEHIAIVDEVDNMLFDRSSALVQISSPNSSTLMPLLYPILIKIYFGVVAAYKNFEDDLRNGTLSSREKHERILYFLKESFKHREKRSTSLERLMLLQDSCNNHSNEGVTRRKPISNKMKGLYSIACAVYLPEVDVKISMNEIRTVVIAELKGNHEFTIFFKECSEKFRDACLYFEDESIAEELRSRKSILIQGRVLETKMVTGSESSYMSSIFSTHRRMERDCHQSYRLARVLDGEEGFNNVGVFKFLLQRGHVGEFKNEREFFKNGVCIIQDEPSELLDDIIIYLRYVHRYCYYSQIYFHDEGDMILKHYKRKIRGKFKRSARNRDNIVSDFDHFLHEFSTSRRFVQERKEDRLRNKLRLNPKYGDLIYTLPFTQRIYALLNFDIWVESCYNAIFFINKNDSYVKFQKKNEIVKVDSQNTGVLQRDTQVGRGIEQFIGMKENSSIPLPMIISTFHGIAQYFNKYTKIFGVTGTLGNENTREFLRKTYHVSTIDIPSHYHNRMKNIDEVEARLCDFYREPGEPEERFYRCFQYPSLVVKEHSDWLDAICESTQLQLTLNRPVLVFCKSVAVVTEIENHMIESFRSLGLAGKIRRYDALHSLEKHMFKSTFVLLATIIAGRGINLTFEDSMYRAGGLHVCLTFIPSSKRVELQCVGRTARKGNMGTAQLLVHDPKERTIGVLRAIRDEADLAKIKEAQIATQRFNDAHEFSAEFNEYITEFTEKYDKTRKREAKVAHLNNSWQKEYEKLVAEKKNTSEIREEKKEFLRTHGGNYSEHVKNAFLNYSDLGVPGEPYSISCRDALKEKWGYWLSEHCFNDSIYKDRIPKEKFNLFLKNCRSLEVQKEDHRIFIAKQAFDLLTQEMNAITRSKLVDLFYQSGVESFVEDKIRNRETSCQLHRYCAMAIYYFAVFKFKLIEFEKLSVRAHLSEVKQILGISEQYIDTEIMSLYQEIQDLIQKESPIYQEMENVLRAFRALKDNVTSLRSDIDETLNSIDSQVYCDQCSSVCKLYPYSNARGDGVDMRTVEAHCNSFGYFGYFEFFYGTRDLVRESKSKSNFFKFNILYLIRRWFASLRRNRQLSLIEQLLQNVESLNSNIELDTRTRANYIEFANRESLIDSKFSRKITLQRMTDFGMQPAKSDNRLSMEFSRIQNLQRVTDLKDELSEKQNSFENHIPEFILKHYSSQDARDSYLPTFLFGCVAKEGNLRSEYNKFMEKRQKNYFKSLQKSVREYNRLGCAAIKVKKYVEEVDNELRRLTGSYRYRWDKMHEEYLLQNKINETKAKGSYDNFVFLVISRYMNIAQQCLNIEYEKRLGNILMKEVYDSLEKNELKGREQHCPCCAVPLNKIYALDSIAQTFGLIIVVYKDCKRLYTFPVDNPVGVERVSFSYETSANGKELFIWRVRQRKNKCLVKLLRLYHKYRDIQGLLMRNNALLVETQLFLSHEDIEKFKGNAWYTLINDGRISSVLDYGMFDYCSAVLEKHERAKLEGLHHMDN